MADILIRGVDMPDGCHNCGFSYFNKGETNGGELCTVLMCSIINQGTICADYDGNRPSWCPLAPLPEGHGRLIDGDKLTGEMKNRKWMIGRASDPDCLVFDAPTIVPAEGGADNGT